MVENAGEILIFDRAQVQKNRERSALSPRDHLFLLEWADRQLQDRLFDIKRRFPLALQIGTRSSAFTSDKIDRIVTLDFSNASVVADEEFLPFKENAFDLVLSSLNLHSVNDLPGTFLQIRKSLKPDGLFMAPMLGGETLYELRESLMKTELELKGGASPRIFPFADKPQTGALLQRAGYALPVVDSEIVTVTYENIFRLMHDLRLMGEGNVIRNRHKSNPGKEFFMKAGEYYHKNFAEADGRIRATFEIIFLIGWAPHESQQQALRPGSAKLRLADALSTQEVKTGEKARP